MPSESFPGKIGMKNEERNLMLVDIRMQSESVSGKIGMENEERNLMLVDTYAI